MEEGRFVLCRRASDPNGLASMIRARLFAGPGKPNEVTPVRLPPGRPRLATSPNSTGLPLR